MAIYKLTKDVEGNSNGVRKTISEENMGTDSWKAEYLFIPESVENTDWQEYLEWVAEGNTAEAAD